MAAKSKPKKAKDVLKQVPVPEVLARLGVDVGKGRRVAGGKGDKVRFPCPYHDGEGDNLEMRLVADEKYAAGEHTCYVCGTTGTEGGTGTKPKHADFAKFYAQMTGVNRSQALAELEKMYGGGEELQPEVDRLAVGEWHQQLMTNETAADKLLTMKGITRDTIARRELGYQPETKRYTIPVADSHGRVINVRRYLLDRPPGGDPKHKMINIAGHGGLALYPMDNMTRATKEFERSELRTNARELVSAADPQDEPVVLTEGEVKALLLEQYGFRAVSCTGGANSWNNLLTAQFKDRTVYVCYDIDAPGKRAAKRIAGMLRKTAKWVGVMELPLDVSKKQKDITDYFVTSNYSAQDFANLMLETKEYVPRGRKSIDEDDDAPPQQVSLRNSVKAQYSGKKIETEFVVATKDTSPFIIPRRIMVNCGRDAGDICEACAVGTRGAIEGLDDGEFELAEADPATLRLLNVRHEHQEKVLREIHGIMRCNKAVIEPVETENIEFMKMVPSIDVSNPERAEEDCSRMGYRVGFGIEPNVTYKGEGYVMPDPQSQTAVLMFTGVVPAVDSLAEFNDTVGVEDLEDLRVFQPKHPDDTESVFEKLEELYADLSMNVTGIYDRDDMHLFMDLCWHSVLYLPGHVFNKHEPERGWCDMLVIGDTRQGKTETAQRLRSHYGLGAWAPAKICTRAGLIGNAQQVGNRWHIGWGIVPNNDRQLVVIEEAKGMEKEVVRQLTDLRSSGKATIIMVESSSAHARTRLLWLSNPRSDRSLNTYPFGVEAVKELVGAQEDISRYTAVMCVASGEVDEEVLSGNPGDRKPPEHWATTTRCRRLILWAWTRRSEDIIFTPGAQARIRELVKGHAEKYSQSIPLVEPADHRFKIGRLAAALAARLFSTDESLRKLVVHEAHVQFIGEQLEAWFDNPHFGYDQWSAIERGATEVKHEERVRAAIMHASEDWPAACTAMLSLGEINNMDLEDLFGLDRSDARTLMSTLTQCHCLRRRKQARYRTPSFNSLLKTMIREHEQGIALAPELPAPGAEEVGDDDF